MTDQAKAPRRRVKTMPDLDGRWWVVTVPSLDPLAGPYERREAAVYVKDRIQEVLDREPQPERLVVRRG